MKDSEERIPPPGTGRACQPARPKLATTHTGGGLTPKLSLRLGAKYERIEDRLRRFVG